MPSAQDKSNLTKLAVGTVSLITATTLGTGVVGYFLGTTQSQGHQTINVQTSLTGTGAGTTNRAVFYDYTKHMGYTQLTATGGELKQEYAIGRWAFPEAYTGALVGICIDVATAPTSNATFVDVAIQDDAVFTSTGKLVMNNVSLTAGSHCANFTGSGAVSGTSGPTIGPDQQVILLSSFGTGAGLVGDWDVMYRETELN